MPVSPRLLVLLLLTGPCLAAPQPRVDRVDIVAAGIFKAKVAKKVPSPGSATGTRNEVVSETLLRRTTQVPARLGVEFGFRYRIVGTPKGANVPVKIVTIYPGDGLKNPNAGTPTQREELATDRPIGRVLYESYRFEHDWELVPGVWTFEIWHGDKKLAAPSFAVAASPR